MLPETVTVVTVLRKFWATFTLPVTSTSPLAVWLPVNAKVVPLNVKFASPFKLSASKAVIILLSAPLAISKLL